ncbi:MAG: hypothetical protein ABI905_16370 [Betaproteobacteria bacterium]
MSRIESSIGRGHVACVADLLLTGFVRLNDVHHLHHFSPWPGAASSARHSPDITTTNQLSACRHHPADFMPDKVACSLNFEENTSIHAPLQPFCLQTPRQCWSLVVRFYFSPVARRKQRDTAFSFLNSQPKRTQTTSNNTTTPYTQKIKAVKTPWHTSVVISFPVSGQPHRGAAGLLPSAMSAIHRSTRPGSCVS